MTASTTIHNRSARAVAVTVALVALGAVVGCSDSSDGAQAAKPRATSTPEAGRGVPQTTAVATVDGTWTPVPDVTGAAFGTELTSNTPLLRISIDGRDGGILDLTGNDPARRVVDGPDRVVPAGRRLLVGAPDPVAPMVERWTLRQLDEGDGDGRRLPDGLGVLAATSPQIAVFVPPSTDADTLRPVVVDLVDLSVNPAPPVPAGQPIALGRTTVIIGTDPIAPAPGQAAKLAVHRLDHDRWVTQLGPPVDLVDQRGIRRSAATITPRRSDALVSVAGGRFARVGADGRITSLDEVAPNPGGRLTVSVWVPESDDDLAMALDRSDDAAIDRWQTDPGRWKTVGPPSDLGDPPVVVAPVAIADGRTLVHLQDATGTSLWWFEPTGA